MSSANKDSSSLKKPIRRLPEGFDGFPDTQAVLAVLGSRRRCQILRTLHDAGEAMSPKELSKVPELRYHANLNYHCRLMEKAGVLFVTDAGLGRRGGVEHFFASTVEDNAVVRQHLAQGVQ